MHQLATLSYFVLQLATLWVQISKYQNSVNSVGKLLLPKPPLLAIVATSAILDTISKSRKKKKDAKLSKEEFAQLKALEEKNGASKLNDD